MSAEQDQAAPTRGPERRSLLMAGLVLLVTYGAYQASTGVWFQGAFKESKKWTWVDLTPESLSTLGVVPSPTGGRPAMYEIAGMPAATTWVLVAAIAAILAFVARLGILALIGVGAAWMARSSALFAQELLLRSEELNGRVVETAGLATYLDWCWLLMGSLVLLAVQITYAARRRRKAQEAAEEAQDEGMLDTLEGIQASLLARLARTSPNRQSAQAQTDANADSKTTPASS